MSGELLDSTVADRHPPQTLIESNPGLSPDPRPQASGPCRCGRAPRAPGRAFCAECDAAFAKLWTTPPDPRYGPCREID